MEDPVAHPAERYLPFTPLDQRFQAGGAPPGTHLKRQSKNSSWRALSLRQPYLYFLLILNLVLLADIEGLRQISKRRLGLQQLRVLNPTFNRLEHPILLFPDAIKSIRN